MEQHSNRSRTALPNSFGVYVHVPFCVHKCSYCDFYSFTKYASSDFEAWTARVVKELGEAAAWAAENGGTPPARSVFLGGGTPSLLPVPLLSRVFDALEASFPLEEGAEITVEANPETVTDELCLAYRTDGRINRVSLGAQSFSPEMLRNLDRLGGRESIGTAARLLKKHGFFNFSLDLIFGIPGQGLKGMLEDIEEAARLEPRHLSFYNLTLKPAHTLYASLPDDDEAAELYERGMERLKELGYDRYEISNFSRPGHPSRHNLLYWDGGDFLGVGPSAASRFFRENAFLHRKQVADFSRYLESGGFPSPGFERTTPAQTVLEASFLELRKTSGVSLSAFQNRYGYDLASSKNYPVFDRHGLLDRDGDTLRLTARGLMLADRVTRDLVDVAS